MKNGIYSRKDMVEMFNGIYLVPCKDVRSYFKRHGWKWDIIWKNLEEAGFIRIGDTNDRRRI